MGNELTYDEKTKIIIEKERYENAIEKMQTELTDGSVMDCMLSYVRGQNEPEIHRLKCLLAICNNKLKADLREKVRNGFNFIENGRLQGN